MVNLIIFYRYSIYIELTQGSVLFYLNPIHIFYGSNSAHIYPAAYLATVYFYHEMLFLLCHNRMVVITMIMAFACFNFPTFRT